jgi:hypothetical protein
VYLGTIALRFPGANPDFQEERQVLLNPSYLGSDSWVRRGLENLVDCYMGMLGRRIRLRG